VFRSTFLSGHSLRFLAESLSSGSVTTKPKRRPYLLKRKALTTGFFDNKGKDEKEKGEHKAIPVDRAAISQYFRRDEKQSESPVIINDGVIIYLYQEQSSSSSIKTLFAKEWDAT